MNIPMKNRMRKGPALILTLAIIASVQTAKDLKSGPCFKFKVTNGDNVTKIFVEHDEGSTIEAAADSCNGRRILNLSISTPVGTLSNCPETAAPIKRHPDYELFPGVGYYRLQRVGLNWESAQEMCRAEGGDLAVIDSKAKANAAVALLQRNITFSEASSSDWAWVGFKKENGETKNVFGDPISKEGYVFQRAIAYTTKDRDCFLISDDGLFSDEKCVIRAAYICELPL